jgi:hypothetical protein
MGIIMVDFCVILWTLKKIYGLCRREVLYKHVESHIFTKLGRLIKICLNETDTKIWMGLYLSDTFPIQDGLKQHVSITIDFPTLL